MNITLFGGSFNPPHLGHRLAISQAFETIPNLSEVWLLPDNKHAFPKNSTLAPIKHRLSMAKLLENGNIKLETCIIDQKMTSGHTIEPVRYLKNKYPQHQFSFLLGSDNLESFTKWGNWEKLLELIPFYIYPRVGFPIDSLHKNMTALEHPLQIITNISSTMVRKRIHQKLGIKHLVSEKIAEYIKTNQLFT